MKYFKIFSVLFSVTVAAGLKAQNITSWTEQNGVLGLGYPVPIPVDTPEPFDGFRTYNGLLAKHQSMAMNNDAITAHIVGQTHYNRDIWAYVLSDADEVTRYGVKEGAMLVNGGIHAREWQSPETLTQIITDFHENANDNSFYQYLLENAVIVTIPVNNVDGFLQTQRYPTQNWYSNSIGPRDGRMRRKNLLDTDEILSTQSDFLNGVDLNRNNNPYWASSNSSSSNPTSIVYHGPAVQSEPETQARLAAAELIDADQLRIYTDVHSFSQVHFANRTNNTDLNTLQSRVLADFTSHHQAFPAGKNYVDRSSFTTPGFGIGSTDEYFQLTYQIPSWTLEIEPSGTLNPDAHPNLPGVGADYGGFANNGHDGFILPESEIKRVREQLAESFMVVWYGQAGPPSITQYRIINQANNAIVFDAEWDIQPNGERVLFEHQYDQILADQTYTLLLRFDKPMRDRNEAGEIQALQGQSTVIDPVIRAEADNTSVALNLSNGVWLNEKNHTWKSYQYYQDDSYVVDFKLDSDVVVGNDTLINFQIITTDLVGQNIDANPATVVTWADGKWLNYENTEGEASISGGFDKSLKLSISAQAATNTRMQKPQTALLFDPNRNGEGFNFEALANDNTLLQWYTFDENGQDQWLLGTAPLMAENAVMIPELLQTTGGVFGDAFDPDAVEFIEKGAVEMIFNAAQLTLGPFDETLWVQNGTMKYTAPSGQKFRTNIVPITYPKGLNSATDQGVILPENQLNGASVVGSWFNPDRDGEGFHIQETINGNAVILWYSYDLEGQQKWFIGSNGVVNETNDNVQFIFDDVFEVSQGTVFGPEFNPNDIQQSVWGSIEVNLQCTSGRFSFTANDSAYGTDEYDVVPITRPVANSFVCPTSQKLFSRTAEPVYQSPAELAADPAIVRQGDNLMMYYSAADYAIGVVISTDDGLSWNSPDGNNNLDYAALRGNPSGWDQTLETVDVLKVGEAYWMYYTGYVEGMDDNGGIVNNYEIGLATSADGINFTRHPQSINQPILSRNRDDNTALDRHAMTSPGVVYDNGKFYMIYAGWNVSNNWTGPNAGLRILGATSDDGINWTKISEPIIVPSEVTYSPDVNEASLLKSIDGRWYIPFSTDVSIGIARANSFTGPYDIYTEAIVTPEYAWDSEVTAPDGLIENNKMRLWYHGVKAPEYWPWVVGYSEASYPLNW